MESESEGEETRGPQCIMECPCQKPKPMKQASPNYKLFGNGEF